MVTFVIGETAYGGTGTDGTNLRDFWSFDPVLSIEKENLLSYKVFPNPSTEIVSIVGLEFGGTVEIYNMNGQLVFNTTTKQNLQIRKSEVGEGSFLLKVELGDKVQTKMIEFL